MTTKVTAIQRKVLDAPVVECPVLSGTAHDALLVLTETTLQAFDTSLRLWPKWTHKFPAGACPKGLTVSNDVAYCVAGNTLYALHVDDGTRPKEWKEGFFKSTSGNDFLPPVAHEGQDHIYVIDEGGTVYKVSRDWGTDRGSAGWQVTPQAGLVNWPPATDGTWLYYQVDHYLLAIDLESGAEQWRLNLKEYDDASDGWTAASPLIAWQRRSEGYMSVILRDDRSFCWILVTRSDLSTKKLPSCLTTLTDGESRSAKVLHLRQEAGMAICHPPAGQPVIDPSPWDFSTALFSWIPLDEPQKVSPIGCPWYTEPRSWRRFAGKSLGTALYGAANPPAKAPPTFLLAVDDTVQLRRTDHLATVIGEYTIDLQRSHGPVCSGDRKVYMTGTALVDGKEATFVSEYVEFSPDPKAPGLTTWRKMDLGTPSVPKWSECAFAHAKLPNTGNNENWTRVLIVTTWDEWGGSVEVWRLDQLEVSQPVPGGFSGPISAGVGVFEREVDGKTFLLAPDSTYNTVTVAELPSRSSTTLQVTNPAAICIDDTPEGTAYIVQDSATVKLELSGDPASWKNRHTIPTVKESIAIAVLPCLSCGDHAPHIISRTGSMTADFPEWKTFSVDLGMSHPFRIAGTGCPPWAASLYIANRPPMAPNADYSVHVFQVSMNEKGDSPSYQSVKTIPLIGSDGQPRAPYDLALVPGGKWLLVTGQLVQGLDYSEGATGEIFVIDTLSYQIAAQLAPGIAGDPQGIAVAPERDKVAWLTSELNVVVADLTW